MDKIGPPLLPHHAKMRSSSVKYAILSLLALNYCTGSQSLLEQIRNQRRDQDADLLNRLNQIRDSNDVKEEDGDYMDATGPSILQGQPGVIPASEPPPAANPAANGNPAAATPAENGIRAPPPPMPTGYRRKDRPASPPPIPEGNHPENAPQIVNPSPMPEDFNPKDLSTNGVDTPANVFVRPVIISGEHFLNELRKKREEIAKKQREAADTSEYEEPWNEFKVFDKFLQSVQTRQYAEKKEVADDNDEWKDDDEPKSRDEDEQPINVEPLPIEELPVKRRRRKIEKYLLEPLDLTNPNYENEAPQTEQNPPPPIDDNNIVLFPPPIDDNSMPIVPLPIDDSKMPIIPPPIDDSNIVLFPPLIDDSNIVIVPPPINPPVQPPLANSPNFVPQDNATVNQEQSIEKPKEMKEGLLNPDGTPKVRAKYRR